MQNRKFSEKLRETLASYHNRAIETAQVIEELIAMARDFNQALARGEAMNLSAEEVAFYDALEANEAAAREMKDEVLKQIALELTSHLRSSVSVDWSARSNVRASIRLQIKRILKKYKYPPDKADAATELVLQQAAVMAGQWAAAQKAAPAMAL